MQLLFLLLCLGHVHRQHHALLALLVKKTEVLKRQRMLRRAYLGHEVYGPAAQYLPHVLREGCKRLKHVAAHQLVVLQAHGPQAGPHRLQVGAVGPEAGQGQGHVAEQAFQHQGFVVQLLLGHVQGRHVAQHAGKNGTAPRLHHAPSRRRHVVHRAIGPYNAVVNGQRRALAMASSLAAITRSRSSGWRLPSAPLPARAGGCTDGQK